MQFISRFVFASLTALSFQAYSSEKKKDEVFALQLLSDFLKFQEAYASKKIDLDLARKGTALESLDKENWTYLKRVIALNGLPSRQEYSFDHTKFVLKSAKGTDTLELGQALSGIISLNNKDFEFKIDITQSLEENDKKLKSLLKENFSKTKKTAFQESKMLRTLMNFFSIPQADAMSSIVSAPSRVWNSVSSTFSGLGFAKQQPRAYYGSAPGGGYYTTDSATAERQRAGGVNRNTDSGSHGQAPKGGYYRPQEDWQ